MSKFFSILSFLGFISVFVYSIFSLSSNAQPSFPEAIKTCQTYSKQGSVSYENETFGILVTLQKKGDKCVYKEKIFQNKKFQMLTCNFDKNQLEPIAASMEKYNNTFKKEIAKNPIFEAKMTTNGEVFQKYLVDYKICNITHSKD